MDIARGQTVHGWRWDKKSSDLQLIQDWDTGMEMKSTYNILGSFEMALDRAEMQFSGTGCSWDVTWIEVRHSYEDLHQGETRPGLGWDVNLRGLEGNEMGYKGRGGSITSPNLDMSDMEPVELQHFGAGWRGHGLYGSETRISAPGCMWDVNLGA